MKRVLLLLLLVAFVPGLAFAASQYAVDTSHSSVGFSVRHLGLSKVKGSFQDFNGSVVWDDQDLSKSSIKGVVKIASVDTQNEKRDTHLKASDFFDAAKYPEMKFESKKILKDKDGKYTIVGDLTIKNVTKEISAPLNLTEVLTDPWGKVRRGFETAFKINRNDFGISFNNKLQNGSFVLSEDIEISLDVQGVQG